MAEKKKTKKELEEEEVSKRQIENQTLGSLKSKMIMLEEELEDAETYSEELEAIWEDTSIELKKKVDNYAYVLADLEMRKAFFAAEEDKMNALKKRCETKIAHIKHRLHEFCDGELLVGEKNTFKPKINITSGVNIDLVEPQYITYSISFDNDFLNHIKEQIEQKDVTLMKNCKVSDLPANHPAIYKAKETKSISILKS